MLGQEAPQFARNSQRQLASSNPDVSFGIVAAWQISLAKNFEVLLSAPPRCGMLRPGADSTTRDG